MTYKLKLSTRNQVVIPVEFLKNIGLQPNQINDVVIYKDIDDRWIIATNSQLTQKFASSLKNKLGAKVKAKLAKMSAQEILDAEKNSVSQYFKTNYAKKI